MSRSGEDSMYSQIFFRSDAAFSFPGKPKAREWKRQFPSPGCRFTVVLAGNLDAELSASPDEAALPALPAPLAAPRLRQAIRLMTNSPHRDCSKNRTCATSTAAAPRMPRASWTASSTLYCGSCTSQSSGTPKPYLQRKQASAVPDGLPPSGQCSKHPSPFFNARAICSTMTCTGGCSFSPRRWAARRARSPSKSREAAQLSDGEALTASKAGGSNSAHEKRRGACTSCHDRCAQPLASTDAARPSSSKNTRRPASLASDGSSESTTCAEPDIGGGSEANSRTNCSFNMTDFFP
mmetsp:Transcript_39022/g.101081  ORF Transcript_39022/g.101081 Transcript_39022/m.101081 type:complete len:294 (+) Transcript_39022:304-1185(+)